LFIENCSFFILHSPEPTGQPAQFQAYSAFGEPIPLLTDPATPNSRYGYAGAFGYEAGTDADFPYLHVGARYYDPEIGRFLQRDPIGIERGSNTYAYVANDPLTWVDPTGLWTIGIGLEGSLGLGWVGGKAGGAIHVGHNPCSGWSAALNFDFGLYFGPGGGVSIGPEIIVSSANSADDLSGGTTEVNLNLGVVNVEGGTALNRDGSRYWIGGIGAGIGSIVGVNIGKDWSGIASNNSPIRGGNPGL